MVASGQVRVRGVTADCHGVYWFGPTGPMWLPSVGERVQWLGIFQSNHNGHLSLDARYLSARRAEELVVRVPRGGMAAGSLRPIPDVPPSVPARDSVWNVAVDDTHVYWANNETSGSSGSPSEERVSGDCAAWDIDLRSEWATRGRAQSAVVSCCRQLPSLGPHRNRWASRPWSTGVVSPAAPAGASR